MCEIIDEILISVYSEIEGEFEHDVDNYESKQFVNDFYNAFKYYLSLENANFMISGDNENVKTMFNFDKYCYISYVKDGICYETDEFIIEIYLKMGNESYYNQFDDFRCVVNGYVKAVDSGKYDEIVCSINCNIGENWLNFALKYDGEEHSRISQLDVRN
jgi:hypothetical protein